MDVIQRRFWLAAMRAHYLVRAMEKARGNIFEKNKVRKKNFLNFKLSKERVIS